MLGNLFSNYASQAMFTQGRMAMSGGIAIPVVTVPVALQQVKADEEVPVFAFNAKSEKDEAQKGLLQSQDTNLNPYAKLQMQKAYRNQLIGLLGDSPIARLLTQQYESEYEAELARIREYYEAHPEERDALGGAWYSMNGTTDQGYMDSLANSKGCLGGVSTNSLYDMFRQNRNFYRQKYGTQAGPGGTAEDMVALAKSFIGRVNSDKEGNALFSGGRNQAWCADFVREMAKATFGIDFGGTSAVSGIRDWGIKNNCYHDAKNYTPKVGDLVIEKNGKSHVSIVAKVYPDGSYDTVEGNHGNKVGSRHVKPGTRTVSGFVSLSEYQYYRGKSSRLDTMS